MHELKTILLATANAHKTAEISPLFKAIGIKTITYQETGFPSEIIEDGETFFDNALKKARETFLFFNIPSLSDDSGLVVPALNGEPGVHSARYAGPGAPSSALISKLLSRMSALRGDARRADFECVMVLYCRSEKGAELIKQAQGTVHGRITEHPTGSLGFGYDPVFIPDGYDRTFAEMTITEKNNISHRSRAIRNMLAQITE